MFLVTGASGHLGNVLVRALLARGERVRALLLPDDPGMALEGLDVERVYGNVLDPASLDAALAEVEGVFHLAAVIAIMPGQEQLMQRVNVEGVRNLAQAALRAGVGRVVHVSSVHAFARLPHGVCMDETGPLSVEDPAGDYDRTKAEGMQAMLAAVEEGLDAVIACPTGIIGPHDYLDSEMGQTIYNYARRKPHLLVRGAYDFVDVRDVAQGLIAAYERGRRGEIYLLTGTHVTMAELRRQVQACAGVRSRHIRVPDRLALALARVMERVYRLTGGVPQFTAYSLGTVQDNAVYTCDKARRELGYTARPLCDTLVDTLAWRLR